MPGLSIDQVLDCLNEKRQRATYAAVGEVIGCAAAEVGQHLVAWNKRHGLAGTFRGPRTSWVVRGANSEPTGYDEPGAEKHPDLYQTRDVLKTGQAILLLCNDAEAEADDSRPMSVDELAKQVHALAAAVDGVLRETEHALRALPREAKPTFLEMKLRQAQHRVRDVVRNVAGSNPASPGDL